MRPLQTPQQYVDYFDPFNAECRAYGRLGQEGRQDLAVRAFGYLLLTPTQEAEITQRIVEEEWQSGSDSDGETDGLGHKMWSRCKRDKGQPIRAIVKQLVEGDLGFEQRHIGQMWQDFQGFQSLGILVRDIHLHNYIGGKLVDFGRAWTMFHPCLNQIDYRDLQQERDTDLVDLYTLITDCLRFEEELKLPEGLKKALDDVDGYVDQLEYDWQKWEEIREVAEEYVASDLYADKQPSESGDDSDDLSHLEDEGADSPPLEEGQSRNT